MAVGGTAIAPRPNVEEAWVRLAANATAIPNQLLAALAEAGGPFSSYYASFLAPTDAPTAVAALINGYTTRINARLASAGADPTAVGPGPLTLWAIGLPGTAGSAANGGWATFLGGPGTPAIDTVGAIQTANQLGPLAFNLGNLGTINFSQNPDATAPAGSRPVFNAADLASWVVGLGDLGGSAGTTGWILNNTFGSSDGGIADATGILQLANRLGPAIFNLNVLKSISFLQAPNGTTLVDGQLDAIRAVDIGQWAVGIPGLFFNTGTTGFVANRGFGIELGTADWVGGLQTTTQIGPFSFTFNFLPAGSFPPLAITPNATSFAVNQPPVVNGLSSTSIETAGRQMSALESPSPQPSLDASNDPAVPDVVAAAATAPAESGASSTRVVSPTAEALHAAPPVPAKVPETPLGSSGSGATDQLTPADDPKPSAAANPPAATGPDASGAPNTGPTVRPSNGARHAAADGSSTVDGKGASGDAYTGRHRADDGQGSSGDAYTGKHRADDGYTGKHRLGDDSVNQDGGGTNDSGSTDQP